jgi:hypothetical protein
MSCNWYSGTGREGHWFLVCKGTYYLVHPALWLSDVNQYSS